MKKEDRDLIWDKLSDVDDILNDIRNMLLEGDKEE